MPLDNQSPELFGQTPSQTVGPFFHHALPWKGGADLIGPSQLGARTDLFPRDHDLLGNSSAHPSPRGAHIVISGRVLDGTGAPIPDAMLEIWQANAEGKYASGADPRDLSEDTGFAGFARAATSAIGEYVFRTVMPGRVPGPGGALQAPHIAVSVFGRGILKRLVTRIYFGNTDGNDSDPILAAVPASRRHTLLARSDETGKWLFDIILQGAGETVFFDL